MADTSQQKKILSNTAYTIGAGLLMNGVLQLAIYPLLHRRLGSDSLGSLLFLMGIATILGPSVGQALNNSRLVVRRDYPVTNGDYDWLLLIFGGIGTAIGLFIGRDSLTSFPFALVLIVLFMLTVFRYYGDVEYRLNLNYRRYFVYYAVLTIGYVAGYGLFLFTGFWPLIFLTGETICLVYLAMTGQLFKSFFRRSEYFAPTFRRGGILVLSYTITNLTLNLDRILLPFLIGNTALTQYYTASLLGKTLVLFMAPINTIIISYLTKTQKRLNRAGFLKFVGIGAAVAGIFFLAVQIAAPIFLKLFYGKEMLDSVREVLPIVNASQILGLFSAYLFILVLTFTAEKWQMVLQVAHLAVILALVFLVTGGTLWGFSLSVLIANAIRVAAVFVFGLAGAGRHIKEEFCKQ